MKITLEDLNAQLGKDDILISKVGKETLHDNSNDNCVKVVNFATSKNLAAKSTMFLHQNIHKYMRSSPDVETHNHISQENAFKYTQCMIFQGN
jgi:hypothetical protein